MSRKEGKTLLQCSLVVSSIPIVEYASTVNVILFSCFTSFCLTLNGKYIYLKTFSLCPEKEEGQEIGT